MGSLIRAPFGAPGVDNEAAVSAPAPFSVLSGPEGFRPSYTKFVTSIAIPANRGPGLGCAVIEVSLIPGTQMDPAEFGTAVLRSVCNAANLSQKHVFPFAPQHHFRFRVAYDSAVEIFGKKIAAPLFGPDGTLSQALIVDNTLAIVPAETNLFVIAGLKEAFSVVLREPEHTLSPAWNVYFARSRSSERAKNDSNCFDPGIFTQIIDLRVTRRVHEYMNAIARHERKKIRVLKAEAALPEGGFPD